MIFLLIKEVNFFFQERHIFELTILEIRIAAGESKVSVEEALKKKKASCPQIRTLRNSGTKLSEEKLSI